MNTESSISMNNLSRSRSNPEGTDDQGPVTPVTRHSDESARTPYNPNKVCMVCEKELSWYNRKRKCTLCYAVVCSECASRKVIPGEVVCRSCEINRNLQRELSESPPTSVDPASRQSPVMDGDVVVLPEDNPAEAANRRNAIRGGYYANLNLKLFEARGLIASDMNMLGRMTSSDPFCIMTLSVDQTRKSSRIIPNTLDPVWGQEFDIGVKTPTQNLEIAVYDHDVAARDDLLGRVVIPIDRLPNGKTIAGWMSLHFEKELENGTSIAVAAGQIYLSARIDYRLRSELRAYVRASVFTPPPRKVSFDINALYGPLMLVMEIVWTRTFEPIFKVLMYIVLWENFVVSFLATLLWIPLGLYISYAPAALFAILCLTMIYNWVRKVYGSLVEPGKVEKKSTSTLSKIPGGTLITNVGKGIGKGIGEVGKGIASITMLDRVVATPGKQKQLPASAQEESSSIGESEQSLGSLVSKGMLICPGWVKEMLASYQPLVRTLTDQITMLYDVLHTTHEHSGLAFILFLVMGTVCVFVEFRILAAAAGSFALFSMSPIMGIFFGLINYLTRKAKWTNAEKFAMAPEFDPNTISEAASKKKRPLHSRGTVYMQKGSSVWQSRQNTFA